MANSRIVTTGDGSTTQFAINFTLGFLDRDHVTCQVNNEVDGSGDPVYRTLTWINDGLVQVGGAVPGNGESVVFERTVPKNELWHDYSDGVPVDDEHLDESNKHTIMMVHEIIDGRINEFIADLNMSGFKITNMADGVLNTDAATVGQIGNAPVYAAQAAASAAAAEAALDNFDDRFLGTKSSDPTLDNDGDALTEGVFYWNTGTDGFRVYNGSTWEAMSVSPGLLANLDSVDTAHLDDNAVTLAKLAGGTAGRFLGFDGSGDPAELEVVQVGRLLDVQVFTASGTWTKPAGTNSVITYVVGGGAAGGGASATGSGQFCVGAGGGAGGVAMDYIDTGLGSTETVTVGAGATGSAASSGNNGTASSFGAHVTALGGTQGNISSTATFNTSSRGGAGGGTTGALVGVTGLEVKRS